MRTFAIGDIHGELEQLDEALARVDEVAGRGPALVVFLGDYVDRGPDSRGVIERLMAGPRRDAHRWARLRGNHDHGLAAWYLGNENFYHMSLNHGGIQTAASYGAGPEQHAHVRSWFPERHVEWIASLPLWHDDGERYYVHAGMSPEARHPRECSGDVLMWIREPFLSEAGAAERLVVHGHTICRGGQPDVLPHRLGLDTGAFRRPGGRLTLAHWEGPGAPVELWQTLPNREQRRTR